MRVSAPFLLAVLLLSCDPPQPSSEVEQSDSSPSEAAPVPAPSAQTSAPAQGASLSSSPMGERVSRGVEVVLDAGQVASAEPKALAAALDADLASGSGLPCDVAEVLAKHCLKCHGEPPLSPLSLTSQAHFAVAAPSDPSQKVHQRVKARIHDSDQTMPPRSTQDKLSAAELATLDAWLDQGAPRSAEGCVIGQSDAGASAPERDRSDCEFDLSVRANDGVNGNDDSAFPVPKGIEVYECFNFEMPWDLPAHALSFEGLIDNSAVLHHMALYSAEQKLPPGKVAGKCTSEGMRAGLAAWAPGDGPTVLPKDVGVKLTKGATLQLEMHYNNVSGKADERDRSGMRICATSKLRPHEAGPVIFGSLCLGDLCTGLPPGKSEVSNTCINLSNKGPAHVLWTSPHMHKLGRHMKTVITRSDGTKDVLTDAEFDFLDQRDYPSDKLIYPGDAVTTTCTYENTTNEFVRWGETGGDEMCFNFLMVYPPDSIATIDGVCTGLF